MQSLNRAEIIGNITADPELQQTTNGNQFVAFSVATNRSRKDKDGNKVDAVDFHNVIARGNLAGIIYDYVRKGKKLFIAGRMETQSREKEDGSKGYKMQIVAEQMLMLSDSKLSKDSEVNASKPSDDGDLPF